jgi:hypothetical protein
MLGGRVLYPLQASELNPEQRKRRLPQRGWLNFPANGRMLRMQTNLSTFVAVSKPAGGEMSGLTAHFLFGPIS